MTALGVGILRQLLKPVFLQVLEDGGFLSIVDKEFSVNDHLNEASFVGETFVVSIELLDQQFLSDEIKTVIFEIEFLQPS